MTTGLRDTYLPPTGFDHELSGQVRSWLGLQGANDNTLVQGITGYNLEDKGASTGVQADFPEKSGPRSGTPLWAAEIRKGNRAEVTSLEGEESIPVGPSRFLTCQWWKTDREKACPWV